MSVLHEFQVNRDWNDAYRSRLDALRVQLTQQSALARAEAERDREREEKERQHQENQRLRERLRALGVDPDA
ncbi:MAG: hypothetical protein V4850_31630 [Myxococcota bacterium]